MSLLDLSSSRSLQLGLQVPGGKGVGILYTIIAIPLQANIHVDDVGLAVGTLVFFRLTGQIKLYDSKTSNSTDTRPLYKEFR